jgi:hypothetical protein
MFSKTGDTRLRRNLRCLLVLLCYNITSRVVREGLGFAALIRVISSLRFKIESSNIINSGLNQPLLELKRIKHQSSKHQVTLPAQL